MNQTRRNGMSTNRYWAASPVLFLAAALALAGCNSNTATPNVPNGVTAVSGSGQGVNVNSAAPNPLVVLVVDENGQPFPGGAVSWQVTGGGGTLSDSTSTADAHGHASITYTAGPNPGTATVVATVAQVWTTNFTLHVVAP
jgi:hypothetical protein